MGLYQAFFTHLIIYGRAFLYNLFFLCLWLNVLASLLLMKGKFDLYKISKSLYKIIYLISYSLMASFFYFSLFCLKIIIISKRSSYFMELLQVLLLIFKSHVLLNIFWIIIFWSKPRLSFLLNTNVGHVLYYFHDYITRCKMCNEY